VKIGLLEWDIPAALRESLKCEVEEKKVRCYKDEFGNIVCTIVLEENVDKTREALLDAI